MFTLYYHPYFLAGVFLVFGFFAAVELSWRSCSSTYLSMFDSRGKRLFEQPRPGTPNTKWREEGKEEEEEEDDDDDDDDKKLKGRPIRTTRPLD